jgi:1,2-diacylglycerol 3-alpha-glucosyltransferase
MRILIITATYLPTINGVSLSVKIQRDELTARGHKVTIIAPRHPDQSRETGVVRLPSIPNPKYRDYPLMIPVPYKEVHFKLLQKKIDLIYFHHPFFIGDVAVTLGKLYKCPTVFFYHTQYDEYAKMFLPKQIPHRPFKKYINNHIKELSAKVNRIIVETATLKTKLKRLGVKTGISVITSGRNSMKIEEVNKSTLRKKYGTPQKSVVILCTSRLSKEKNIKALLGIIKNIKTKNTFDLLIAGDGPERESLKNLATKWGLKNVTFLGNVDYKNLPEIYSQSDIFVFPSKTDTQGIVIIEAMTAHLPIIGFNSPGPKDFIVEGKNGFICSTNNGLKKQLTKLIQNQKMRNEMGKMSANYSKNYTLSASIDKIEKTLEKVISKHNH